MAYYWFRNFFNAIYKITVFAQFGIGLTIFIIGTIYYIIKLKISCIEEFFDKNTAKSLSELP